MPNQRHAVVQRMIDAGESEDNIALVIREFPKESTPDKSSWTDSLPTIGGIAGSLVGGSKMSPVGMALAGVGGAAGEAFRQVADSVRGDFSDVPETVGGRLRRIGEEGLRQGGLEGVGRGVGAAVVRPIAKAIYGTALRPSMALMREAGNGKKLAGLKRIVSQGFDDRVMPSGMGIDRASKLVSQSADEATQIAAKSPATVQASRVFQRATDDQAKRSTSELLNAGVTPKTDAIASQIGNLLDSNPKMLDMSQLLSIRRGAEKVAAPAFKAAKMPGGAGNVPTGSIPSVARSISGAAKQGLDDSLGAAFGQVNRRTQSRAIVSQAVQDAAARPNMLFNIAAGAAGVGSSGGDMGEAAKRALILRTALSPTVQGGAALALGARSVSPQVVRLLDMIMRGQE